MFSAFIYVENKVNEELRSRGEYPCTWHPAKVQDPKFQEVLNKQRQRDLQDPTRDREGNMSKMED
eukprot:6045291-Amphidinium_carterae.1